jgi:hypothetical protein
LEGWGQQHTSSSWQQEQEEQEREEQQEQQEQQSDDASECLELQSQQLQGLQLQLPQPGACDLPCAGASASLLSAHSAGQKERKQKTGAPLFLFDDDDDGLEADWSTTIM